MLQYLAAGVDALSNIWAAKTNADSLDWQKEAYKKTQQREDTAAQRRVADLRAAGLSPTLAAGSPAAASLPPSPVRVEGTKLSQSLIDAMSLMKMKTDISKTVADEEKVRQEIVGQQIANQFAAAMNPVTEKIKNLEAQLIEATNPANIIKIVEEARRAPEETKKVIADTKLSESRQDQVIVETVKKKVETEAVKLGMNKTDVEIATAVISNRIRGIEEEEKRFNVDTYKMLNIPTDRNLGLGEKAGLIVGNALGGVLGKIRSALPKVPKKETYLESYRRAMR